MNVTDSVINHFKELFYQRGEDVLPFSVNSSLSKLLFLSKYNTLEPFFDRPVNEQDEMIAYVGDLFPEKTAEQKAEACKIIYTIGNLL